MWLFVYDMLVNVNVIYYVHVCEQARWARSAGNSAIENLCIIIIIKEEKDLCRSVGYPPPPPQKKKKERRTITFISGRFSEERHAYRWHQKNKSVQRGSAILGSLKLYIFSTGVKWKSIQKSSFVKLFKTSVNNIQKWTFKSGNSVQVSQFWDRNYSTLESDHLLVWQAQEYLI